jgi:hypothetical protein
VDDSFEDEVTSFLYSADVITQVQMAEVATSAISPLC